jgi:ketosteroid isomerase-like protein
VTSNLEVSQQFYDALGQMDPTRLLELLHPDFRGHVTEGLPGGLGGTYEGPQVMLTEVWGPVARRFGIRAVPSRFLTSSDGDVVVIGEYVGQPPESDEPMTAAFMHVLSFRDDRIVSLRQVTDSQRWCEAAAAADLAVVARMFDSVENRDAEALFDTYAEDITIREACSLPYGGVYHGHEGGLQHGLAYVQAWDPLQAPGDRRLDPQILYAGDRVFVIWRQRGTANDGAELFDHPVIDMIHVKDGKVSSLQMFPEDSVATADFLRNHRAGV